MNQLNGDILVITMENNIFREKSIDRIKSPDMLDEYIKVANPGIWLCLTAILIFVVGGLTFSIFADIESKVPTAVVVDEKSAICYLSEDKLQYVSDELWVEVGDNKYALHEHGNELKKLSSESESDEELLYFMGKEEGGWYYMYPFETNGMEPGIYRGEIIIDSVKPISFLINGK